MSSSSQVTDFSDLITDLAWAAGILDGEGCIILVRHAGLKRKTESWLLRVDVGNTDPKMLLKMRSLFGGTIVKKKDKDRYKPQWRWIVYGANAVNVLNKTMPYLVTKKDQAEVALLSRQFLRGKHDGGNVVKLAEMQRLGRLLSDLKHVPQTMDIH